ncbi:bifunctional serine/threonine-protein kinase/ABC transporter substrate-binding protein [Streptomyces sp. NPDC058256]|uniref:bifunctional serine/threonine-protein kinase/ABC transporter substrate-binding protein n=1 Tax=Streptomyces sp. NPDC058256 TaxID=3346408 RepID=UPI0036E3F79D
MSEPLLPTDPASIGGHRLLARLGAGGMGVVYLGRTEAGALAAVKVIQAEYADEPDFRARFRREVETARRVTSPWAVPVTGADPDAAAPWLATAFVPGPSIEEAVGRHGPLPVRSVRVLGRMLAAALREVHAAGLVHRDVKPANVLLAVDGPRLIDFGIACATDETAITSADMVVGTPGFLSPEQAEARGAAVGPPSDIFSLGCLLAYAVSGRPPFGTGAADALLYRTVHDEPDLAGIEAEEDTEDGELLTLLHMCLAKDPADRPTAEQICTVLLVEDLVPDGGPIDWLPDDVVRGIADRSSKMLALPDIEPTVADAPGDAERPSPGRRRLLLASGAALLMAAGGTAAWAALRDDDPPGASASRTRRWAIGVQADLSGSQRTAGQAQERGARLAIEQFNSRKSKPFTLTVKTADDRGTTEGAPAAAKKLIQDEDVLAVLGPSNNETALEVLPTYDEALLPVLSVSAGGLLLTSQDYRSYLQCRPADAVVAFPMAVHLAALKGARLPGLLQDRTAQTYGWEASQSTTLLLRGFGLQPYPRVIPANTEDVKPVVADMLGAGIDSFIYSGYAPGAARVARELAAAGFEGPRLAPQAVLDPEFLELAGDAAEGWLLTSSFIDASAVPAAAAFRAAFRKRYAAEPGYYAAEAYDTVNLLIQELVKATKRGQPPKRQELVGLLRKSRYKGITKEFAFKPEDGTFDGWGVFLHQVDGGRFRFLGEAPSEV